ncbi:hypothetical protein [Halocatena pleomorpha]|uniref:Uncharacterized protein n=1 Tax=Halocatena pleomorpha TaxID=1785090 RepID=A0A3P3R8S9_9EURY|nr:hypothetical protein [Halocatena pleomorpha]RRJ29448.1 hypothetical protein EIK79_12465 [Halocatena pleomorpha]
MADTTDTEPSQASNAERYRSMTLPGGQGLWLSTGVGIALLLAGMFVFEGTMAGVLGLWGVSLLATSIAGYVMYRLWYQYGS